MPLQYPHMEHSDALAARWETTSNMLAMPKTVFEQLSMRKGLLLFSGILQQPFLDYPSPPQLHKPIEEWENMADRHPDEFHAWREALLACLSTDNSEQEWPELRGLSRQLRLEELVLHGHFRQMYVTILRHINANADAPTFSRAFGMQECLMSDVLRDILPNPFRQTSCIEPVWLGVNDAAVHTLADRIYTERAFHDLPILGDALEEAGCTDAVILGHCRQTRAHVRGCWLLDKILGKQ